MKTELFSPNKMVANLQYFCQLLYLRPSKTCETFRFSYLRDFYRECIQKKKNSYFRWVPQARAVRLYHVQQVTFYYSNERRGNRLHLILYNHSFWTRNNVVTRHLVNHHVENNSKVRVVEELALLEDVNTPSPIPLSPWTLKGVRSALSWKKKLNKYSIRSRFVTIKCYSFVLFVESPHKILAYF